MRYACLTDYKKLYSQEANYFAHSNGNSSYDKSIVDIISNTLKDNNLGLVDIGGGNGFLAQKLREKQHKAITIDVGSHESENFLNFDLSSEQSQDKIVSSIQGVVGSEWLSTCFDVAEHIDIEDLSSFLSNLHSIVHKYGIISISTRPSSKYNRFHSTLLPIATWIYLLKLYGFKAIVCETFQRKAKILSNLGSRDDLVPLRKWFETNPFHEANGANISNYYLQITKVGGIQDDACEELDQILDLSYRKYKREMLASENKQRLPNSIFLIACPQDWLFARPLLDVYLKENVRFIIYKNSNFKDLYLHSVTNYLDRVNIIHYDISRHADIHSILDNLLKEGFAKIVTAADGNIGHVLSSNVLYEARKRGFLAITMQHGMAIKKNTSPTSDYYLCWSSTIKEKLNSTDQFVNKNSCIISAGSPKMLDSLVKIDRRCLSFRLGFATERFQKHILIATNLHWEQSSNNINVDVLDYIQKLCSNHKTTMFIVKPHPADMFLEKRIKDIKADNLTYLPQNILNMIDWSLNRLLKCCDGVITTFSTIVADAECAQVPVSLFPHTNIQAFNNQHIDIDSLNPKNVSLHNINFLNQEDILCGKLPRFESRDNTNQREWHDANRQFLLNFFNALHLRPQELTPDFHRILLEKNLVNSGGV